MRGMICTDKLHGTIRIVVITTISEIRNRGTHQYLVDLRAAGYYGSASSVIIDPLERNILLFCCKIVVLLHIDIIGGTAVTNFKFIRFVVFDKWPSE